MEADYEMLQRTLRVVRESYRVLNRRDYIISVVTKELPSSSYINLLMMDFWCLIAVFLSVFIIKIFLSVFR